MGHKEPGGAVRTGGIISGAGWAQTQLQMKSFCGSLPREKTTKPVSVRIKGFMAGWPRPPADRAVVGKGEKEYRMMNKEAKLDEVNVECRSNGTRQ
jgi:hypothetical protein